MKKTAAIVALLILVPAAALAQDKTYYYSATGKFSLETGYRKTSGVSGALFGHLSVADENQVRKNGQAAAVKAVEKAGIGADRAQFLPVRLSNTQTRVLSTGTADSAGLLGTVKTHSYANFGLTGKMHMGFLSSVKADIPGYERREVTSATVRVRGGFDMDRAHTLGEVKAPVKSLRLGAYTTANAELNVGGLRLTKTLPSLVRHKLGDKIRQVRRNPKGAPDYVSTSVLLKLNDGSTKKVSLGRPELPSERKAMLRQVKAQGAGRFFSPNYYKVKAARVMARRR